MMGPENPDEDWLVRPDALPEIGPRWMLIFRPPGQYRARMMTGIRSSPLEVRLLIVINLAIVAAIVAVLVVK
jgi:hypothetical protein